MLGWFADTFRFAWALLYWNARKSWFQLRRGRAPCPCQSPSDSGRALETGCDACMHWNRPERFRRVCPLLVETAQGLRCSVDTPQVRPFWGRAVRYYGGAALALYAAGVIAVFAFLRTIGYPVSVVHVALPHLWDRVGQARGWFFLTKAQAAFGAGRTTEGLLYLANAYEFDPTFEAGLALATAYQLGQPGRSDEIYAQLLRNHPGKRGVAAQHWFRALLARGEFDQVAALAAEEAMRDRAHADVWMRALVFASRQGGDLEPLRKLLTKRTPAALPWHPILQIELDWRAGRRDAARRQAEQGWTSAMPPYAAFYRVEALRTLASPTAALEALDQLRPRLDDEAYLTLRLDCLAAAAASRTLRAEFETQLLAPPLSQPRLKIMCAQLIRWPEPELLTRVLNKVAVEAMPLSDATAGGWFSLLCAAGAGGQITQLQALTFQLQQATKSPFNALLMAEAFFRTDPNQKRAASFLPYLPLPLEVTYALLERFPGPNPASRQPVPLSP